MPDLKKKGELVKIIINFVVNENGKVTNITTQGSDENFEKEGIRMVKKLPDFIPATKDNKNISSNFSLFFVAQQEK